MTVIPLVIRILTIRSYWLQTLKNWLFMLQKAPVFQVSQVDFFLYFRSQLVWGCCSLHPNEVWEFKQAQRRERSLHTLYMRNRHEQHRLRLWRHHGHHHQEQPQRLWTLLKQSYQPSMRREWCWTWREISELCFCILYLVMAAIYNYFSTNYKHLTSYKYLKSCKENTLES